MAPHDLLPGWPAGGSEMACLIRNHDWAATSLGPVEEWPANLRTLVDLMLGSGMLMCLLWGRDAVMIYNDAYARSIGQRHPAALGRSVHEVWADVRDEWEPLFERAWSGEEAVARDRHLRFAAPDVPRQEAWFDLTYTPVRNEVGEVQGILATARDVTDQMQAEQNRRAVEERQAFLLKLSDAMRPLVDPVEIQTAALRTLAEHLGLSRAAYSEIHEDHDRARRVATYDRDLPPVPTDVRMSDFSAEQLACYLAGRPFVVSDTETDPRVEATRDACRAIQVRAWIGVPLIKGGRLLVVLGVEKMTPHDWSDAEVRLVEEAAERTWAASERGRVEAALRASEERQAFLLGLGDALRLQSSPEGMIEIAARLLGEHLGASRIMFAEFDEAKGVADIFHGWFANGAQPFPAVMQLQDYEGPILGDLRAGRTVRIEDTRDPALARLDLGAIAELGVRALLSVPLIVGGRLVVNLSVHQHSVRSWTDEEVALAQEVAERLWADLVRARAEVSLRESEERLRAFGEASSDVLWIRDAETLDWTYLSPAFERIYGLSREQALHGDTVRNWLDMMVPHDRERARAEIEKARHGEPVTFEYRIKRPSDGEVRLLRNTDFPIRDAAGRVTRIGGVGHDATEEQATAERLQVLVHELQHRTRNLMAVVQSVTGRTLAGSTSLEDFQDRIRDRLGALARVNGLLSRLNEGDRITFDELIRTELKGHGVIDGHNHGLQVNLQGPKGLRLRSSQVQTLALGLHELATNALKHGALSQPEGCLDISWHLVPGPDGKARLRVHWRESGVEVAVPDGTAARGTIDGRPPRRRGYGRELIERALPYQLGAETDYELTSEGVRCTITLPISSTLGTGRSGLEDDIA